LVTTAQLVSEQIQIANQAFIYSNGLVQTTGVVQANVLSASNNAQAVNVIAQSLIRVGTTSENIRIASQTINGANLISSNHFQGVAVLLSTANTNLAVNLSEGTVSASELLTAPSIEGGALDVVSGKFNTVNVGLDAITYVSLTNLGSVTATNQVQTKVLSANVSLSVANGANQVMANNAGGLSASSIVTAPVVLASDRVVAQRSTIQHVVSGASLNVSDTRAASLTLMNTESGNVRANFSVESTLAPVMRIVSTVTNARFEDNGAYDTNVANRGAISSATIGVLPNTELVFSTTNAQNAAVSRGIRMVNAAVPASPTNTVFISPNGDISISGTITAAGFNGIAGVADPLQLNGTLINFARARDDVLFASTSNGSANVARMRLVSVESGESSSNNFNANFQLQYGVHPLFSASAFVTNARFSETGERMANGVVTAASISLGDNVQLRMPSTGNLVLDYASPSQFAEIVGKAGETTLFRISANGQASFTEILAGSSNITNVELTETQSNRILSDVIGVERLGVTRRNDTAQALVPMLLVAYENTFHTETNASNVWTTRVNANLSMTSVGGFNLFANVVNYLYDSNNGLRVNASSTTVQRTLTTGNNFTMRAFGASNLPTALFLGTDSTTLTTIADNGLVRAQTMSATALNISLGVNSVTAFSNGVLAASSIQSTLINVANLTSQILNASNVLNVSNGSNQVLIHSNGSVTASH
jgi:hypothetical protein